MDQGLRGQSACLYLVTDLRRFGWKFHKVARQRHRAFASNEPCYIRRSLINLIRSSIILRSDLKMLQHFASRTHERNWKLLSGNC